MNKKKIAAVLFGAGLFCGFVPVVALAGGSFFIDDTTNYVGIGNTTPQSRLDVAGAMYSRMVTATSSSIDWNQSNVQSLTLSSNPTLTFGNGQAGGEYKLILTQDTTGGRTVTWPASVKWPSNIAPTLSSAASSTDVISFVYNGSTYFGSYQTGYGIPSTPPVINGSVYKAGGAGASSRTVSNVVVGSGLSNSMLLCIVDYEKPSPLTSDVTGVTYGGVGMTQGIAEVQGNIAQFVYALPGPSAGTANVVVSYNRNSSDDDIYCFVVTGAKQTGFPDAVNSTGANTATNVSLGLTTTVNNALVIDSVYGSNNTSNTGVGSGQTLFINDSPSAGTDNSFASWVNKTTAGSITTSQSFAGSIGTNASYINFSIAPAI